MEYSKIQPFSECKLVSAGVGGQYCLRSISGHSFPPLSRVRATESLRLAETSPALSRADGLLLLVLDLVDKLASNLLDTIWSVGSAFVSVILGVFVPIFVMCFPLFKAMLFGALFSVVLASLAGARPTPRLLGEGSVLGLIFSALLTMWERS